MIRRIKTILLKHASSELLSGRLATRLLSRRFGAAGMNNAVKEVINSESSDQDEKVYLYKNALVFSPFGLAFDATGRIITHNLGEDHHKVLRRTIREIGVYRFFFTYFMHIFDKMPVSIQEVCHLVPRHGYRPNAPNYCHWLLEDLPKLSRYARLAQTVDVLVNSKPSAFQTASLNCLDTIGNVIRLNRNFDRVNRLYICKMFSAGSQDGEIDKNGRIWVRDQLLDKVRPKPAEPSYTYIVRNKDARRNLTNDAEVNRSFENNGYEFVNPNHLTFEEQIRLFAKTSILTAVHGAALANMLFMKSGSVYELSHVQISNRVFFGSLAKELGLTYKRSCSNGAYESTKEGNDLISFDADISDIECLINDANPR